MQGIKRLTEEKESQHSWTRLEIEQYHQYWKSGKRERLAFELMLYSDLRRSDIIKMKHEDLDDNILHLVQQKKEIMLQYLFLRNL